MGLPIEKHLQMWEMINKDTEEMKVKKYVSHEDYEELVIQDKHGNIMEIKFFANFEDNNK